MNERLTPPSIDRELQLLYTNPRALAEEYDGKRPPIADLLEIPEGFVIDGTDFPERQSIRGVAIPFRLESSDSVFALRARRQVAKLRKDLGSNLLFVTVRTKEGYPYRWNSGPVLKEDLSQDREILKEEAITAVRENDTRIAGMKLRAILAQLPYLQRDLAPSWEEIFLSDTLNPPNSGKPQLGKD